LLALHYNINSQGHDNLKSDLFFWKGTYFNFRFFLLCKRDEVVMCQKYVYHPGKPEACDGTE